MKLILKLITFSCLFYQVPIVSAQIVPPEYIMYEKTIFNPSSPTNVLPSFSSHFWVSIRDQVGNLIFREEHFLTTENDGDVIIKVGDGLFVGGTVPLLNQINWGVGKYFIQLEFDYNNQIIVLNSEQFVSTPYSYYSKVSGNGIDSIIYSNGTLTTIFENGNSQTVGPLHFQGNGVLISNDTISLDTNFNFFSSMNNTTGGGLNHLIPDGFNNVQPITYSLLNASGANYNNCLGMLTPYTVPVNKNLYITKLSFWMRCQNSSNPCNGIFINGVHVIGSSSVSCNALIPATCTTDVPSNFIVGGGMSIGYSCGMSGGCNSSCGLMSGSFSGYLIDKSVTIIFQSTNYTVPAGKTFISIGNSFVPGMYPSGAFVPPNTNGFLYP